MATSLKIDCEMKVRVQTLAQQRDRSAHWIMREAIRQYVDREEARDDFVREARESWAEYRETGLHLTADEAFAWLDRWGSDGAGPPASHD